MRVRCPNCHDSTEVDDSTALSAVQCASCGSKLSLVADQTLTYTETETKTIGHFELVDEIGSGAFGSVWMAKDTQLDRSVAVKIPRKGQLDPVRSRYSAERQFTATTRVKVVVGRGEQSVRNAIREYLKHYHGERNHQGLANAIIDPGEEVGQVDHETDCRERLGGVLRYYYQRAA